MFKLLMRSIVFKRRSKVFIVKTEKMNTDYVTPEELGGYFRSKRDLYTFLTVDCKVPSFI